MGHNGTTKPTDSRGKNSCYTNCSSAVQRGFPHGGEQGQARGLGVVAHMLVEDRSNCRNLRSRSACFTLLSFLRGCGVPGGRMHLSPPPPLTTWHSRRASNALARAPENLDTPGQGCSAAESHVLVCVPCNLVAAVAVGRQCRSTRVEDCAIRPYPQNLRTPDQRGGGAAREVNTSTARGAREVRTAASSSLHQPRVRAATSRLWRMWCTHSLCSCSSLA